jgi:hypothetical protein
LYASCPLTSLETKALRYQADYCNSPPSWATGLRAKISLSHRKSLHKILSAMHAASEKLGPKQFSVKNSGATPGFYQTKPGRGFRPRPVNRHSRNSPSSKPPLGLASGNLTPQSLDSGKRDAKESDRRTAVRSRACVDSCVERKFGALLECAIQRPGSI